MRKMMLIKTAIILSMVLLANGCAKGTWNEGTINGKNIDVKNDEDIDMKLQEAKINKDNIDFYTYKSGSSSVSKEFVIRRTLFL